MQKRHQRQVLNLGKKILLFDFMVHGLAHFKLNLGLWAIVLRWIQLFLIWTQIYLNWTIKILVKPRLKLKYKFENINFYVKW